MAHWLQSAQKVRAKLFGGEPRVVRRFGHFWLIDPNDILDLRLWAGREYEADLRRRLIALGRQVGVSHFFDIGANFGIYSILVREALPELQKVIAFEPSRAMYAKLSANLWLNGLLPHIEARQHALGAEAGEAVLRVPAGRSGSASLVRGSDGDRAISEPVRVEAFDANFTLSGERLLFKIDVEGFEDAVLNGMRRTLSDNHCVMQIEILQGRDDVVLPILSDLGFRKISDHGRDKVFTNIAGLAERRDPTAADVSDERR